MAEVPRHGTVGKRPERPRGPAPLALCAYARPGWHLDEGAGEGDAVERWTGRPLRTTGRPTSSSPHALWGNLGASVLDVSASELGPRRARSTLQASLDRLGHPRLAVVVGLQAIYAHVVKSRMCSSDSVARRSIAAVDVGASALPSFGRRARKHRLRVLCFSLSLCPRQGSRVSGASGGLGLFSLEPWTGRRAHLCFPGGSPTVRNVPRSHASWACGLGCRFCHVHAHGSEASLVLADFYPLRHSSWLGLRRGSVVAPMLLATLYARDDMHLLPRPEIVIEGHVW